MLSQEQMIEIQEEGRGKKRNLKEVREYFLY